MELSLGLRRVRCRFSSTVLVRWLSPSRSRASGAAWRGVHRPATEALFDCSSKRAVATGSLADGKCHVADDADHYARNAACGRGAIWSRPSVVPDRRRRLDPSSSEQFGQEIEKHADTPRRGAALVIDRVDSVAEAAVADPIFRQAMYQPTIVDCVA